MKGELLRRKGGEFSRKCKKIDKFSSKGAKKFFISKNILIFALEMMKQQARLIPGGT